MSMALGQKSNTRQKLQKILYFAVFSGLMIYLYSLGTEPWVHFVENLPVFLGVMLTSGIGIFVQSVSFLEIQPSNARRVSLLELARIWSFSGVVSVIAPIFAGIATRTTLLVQSGMAVSVCVATTARQIWMGLEYAFLLGGLAAFFVDFQWAVYLAAGMMLSGVVMSLLRIYGSRRTFSWLRGYQVFESLKGHVSARAHPWFIAQMLTMTVTYLIAFNGLGAPISFQEAMLLSAMTVLASLIVLIPNGLGVMDAVWVFVSMSAGLELEKSVALAIIIRLAYLVAAIMAWVLISVASRIMSRAGE